MTLTTYLMTTRFLDADTGCFTNRFPLLFYCEVGLRCGLWTSSKILRSTLFQSEKFFYRVKGAGACYQFWNFKWKHIKRTRKKGYFEYLAKFENAISLGRRWKRLVWIWRENGTRYQNREVSRPLRSEIISSFWSDSDLSPSKGWSWL